MLIDELHPLDVGKLRRIAEMLCDLSAGRLMTRDGLEPLVASLMVCISPFCSSDDAGLVVERLLAAADDRVGARGMADLVLREIERTTYA
jgi:hypothetical protein